VRGATFTFARAFVQEHRRNEGGNVVEAFSLFDPAHASTTAPPLAECNREAPYHLVPGDFKCTGL
jgi:hypothetical protein